MLARSILLGGGDVEREGATSIDQEKIFSHSPRDQ